MGPNKNVQFKETHTYEIVVPGAGKTGNGMPELSIVLTGKPRDGLVKVAFVDSLGVAKWTTTVSVEDFMAGSAKLQYASGYVPKRGGKQ